VKDRDVTTWPDTVSKNGLCIINGELCSRPRAIDSYCHLASPTGSGRACNDNLLVTPQSGCVDINGWTASVASYNGLVLAGNRETSPCVQTWDVIQSLEGVSFCPALNIYADMRPSANNFRAQRLRGAGGGVWCGFAPANRTTDESYHLLEHAAGVISIDTRLLKPKTESNHEKDLPYRSRKVTTSPVYVKDGDATCSKMRFPPLLTPEGNRIVIETLGDDYGFAYSVYEEGGSC